jgi:uncharacterized cupredoxin-like copper-binding protein
VANAATAQEATLGGRALGRARPRTPGTESLRDAIAGLKGTLLTVGALMLAAGVAVVVALITHSTGPAGDVVTKTTEFRISMPSTLSAGRHTFAYTNKGSVPHELIVFRTELPGGALPVKADGSVDEEAAALHKVADSGNETKPGGSTSVRATQAFAPGHYVAVCNLPGHYRQGMWLDLTVRP